MKSILMIGVISFLIIMSGVLLRSQSLNSQNSKTTDLDSNAQKLDLNNLDEAYFAGGCFWCMESIFESQQGVEGAYAGYTGGDETTATYELTSSKTTEHREAVRVVYDPTIISYRKLVELYWTQVNPTDDSGQFNDRGFVYSTAIYYSNEQEKSVAQASKTELEMSGRFDSEIVTPIVLATPFYDAEDYHQNYYKENVIRYNLYTAGSGRKGFIADNWQDRIDELETMNFMDENKYGVGEEQNSGEQKIFVVPDRIGQTSFSESELKIMLTPLQYSVTRQAKTEQAFNNTLWDNKTAGIYVDIIDGTPLFSSRDKYVSGTGWPSFVKPIDLKNITEHEDNFLFIKRIEIRSATTGSHVGHVFNDGPADRGGLRYCMNSAAMRFIPFEEMISLGYSEYVSMVL